MKRHIGLSLLFLFTVMCTNSFAAVITVGNVSAQPGQSFTLPITVNNPGKIAGASFTLTYDKTKLNLKSITSTFFDTFTNQWNSLSPPPNPLPTGTVNVDGLPYNQPLVKNPVSSGMSIAAARCKAGATATTLFTLTFKVLASATPGQLPVNIIQTVLSNENAGYPAGGAAVPILIGASDDPNVPLNQAYPVVPATIVPGTVTVLPGFVDSDGDGIDDVWEMAIFGNLTTADATSDYDRDGYSDLQEYLNIKAGLFDPSHNPYDLKIKNAPWGTGYKPPVRCDFNGDIKSDILLSNNLTGDNVVWFMDGITYVKTADLPKGPSPSENWKIAGSGDFNNDGKPDLLVRNTSTGGVSIWLMDYVDGAPEPTTIVDIPSSLSSAWTFGGIADFNKDGKPDILWRNTTSNDITIWYMNGVTRTGKVTLSAYKPAKEWKIEGVGDFNGDGQSDILLRNSSTSAIQIWFMEYVGGVPTRTVKNTLPYTAPSGWKIVGTGGFNNDALTDIFLWNSATGAASVWYMNGITRTGEASLPTVPVNWTPLN